ncbi:hypothetical protein [Kordiimonas lacus]|uniref:SGNH/GDSL hydrolase family protein n=1 Tax=Kordiimonas lacus TaxID=637679 RepID=A0A1G6Y2F2_9PROT|nr:hypothetical protein [Kordiimonas lacus]SDD84579.1 hypothetical protein SAMN04488071_1459 [Kordiimonas lacus]
MKKLCVIGTSHVGALKTGWDAIKAEQSDWDIVFFGAPDFGVTERLRHVKRRGSKLVSVEKYTREYFKVTSGGQAEIDLEAYDCFLVQGAGIGINLIMRTIYSFFRSERHAMSGGNVLVSEACFSDAVKGLFLSSVAARLADEIAAAVDTPAYLVPSPCPSEGLLSATKTSKKVWMEIMRNWQKIHAAGDHIVLEDQYRAGLDAVRAQGYRLIDIPAEFYSAPCFTKHEYCKGSEWLQDAKYEASPDDDYLHMNGRYGATLLKSFFETVSRETG